jgi:hypothetical protein
MVKGYWGRFFFGVGLISLSMHHRVIRADDYWRPSSSHYQNQESRVDCSIYRSVFANTQETLSKRLNDHKELNLTTKTYFKALTDCQKKNGLSSNNVSDFDAKTAEMCGEAYDQWLMEGTHLLTIEEEISMLKTELETLKGAVSRKCLPTRLAQLK